MQQDLIAVAEAQGIAQFAGLVVIVEPVERLEHVMRLRLVRIIADDDVQIVSAPVDRGNIVPTGVDETRIGHRAGDPRPVVEMRALRERLKLRIGADRLSRDLNDVDLRRDLAVGRQQPSGAVPGPVGGGLHPHLDIAIGLHPRLLGVELRAVIVDGGLAGAVVEALVRGDEVVDVAIDLVLEVLRDPADVQIDRAAADVVRLHAEGAAGGIDHVVVQGDDRLFFPEIHQRRARHRRPQPAAVCTLNQRRTTESLVKDELHASQPAVAGRWRCWGRII